MLRELPFVGCVVVLFVEREMSDADVIRERLESWNGYLRACSMLRPEEAAWGKAGGLAVLVPYPFSR